MDSDDDFLSSPLKEESPQVGHRRLKRLKKINPKTLGNSTPKPIDGPLLFSSVDFAQLEALENGSEIIDFNDSNSSDDPVLYEESLSQENGDGIDDVKEDSLDSRSDVISKKTKRVLEFEDEVMENGMDIGKNKIDFELENVVEKQKTGEGVSENKTDKKKNRGPGDLFKETVVKVPGLNKRREEKDRKAHLKELHAESQRLLRETRGAAFKPMPVMQKPISSVLEKIRKRKLEISKKSVSVRRIGYPSANLSIAREETEIKTIDENTNKPVEMEIDPVILEGHNFSTSDGDKNKEFKRPINDINVQDQVSLHEVPLLPLRAPLDDTQDLFDDSRSNGSTTVWQSENQNNLSEDKFVSPLIDMELKFDSAALDDSSSDEEDNEKENVNPQHRGIPRDSSPEGDPVKNFVDDEAEEEDDSDNDPENLHEEDEISDDIEELQNMIATEYEEEQIDNEKRNALHQRWLEQQDTAGTDNLLQQLNCGSVVRNADLPDNESDSSDEYDEESHDEAQEQPGVNNYARVTIRKAKQIILQMCSDKDDAYLSDNDGNTDLRHAKQRFVGRSDEQDFLVSPANDISSREVFGLIKKLNIVTENKMPKPPSFFDTILTGGNGNSSAKLSFLRRASSNPMPLSRKQSSLAVRSFIFERDDSNSRSSITMSEESSETVSRETHSTKSSTAKYVSSSQNKSSSQKGNVSNSKSNISLLEVLKQSSMKSHTQNEDRVVNLTKSIFSLRGPKRPMKIEGRS